MSIEALANARVLTERGFRDDRVVLLEQGRILDLVDATDARIGGALRHDLGAAPSVSSIRIRLGGSDPMVLPVLRVEGSADGDAWAPLAVHPFPDIRALVDDAADVTMAAEPPAPTPIRWIRLVVGTNETHVRDVAVFTRDAS